MAIIDELTDKPKPPQTDGMGLEEAIKEFIKLDHVVKDAASNRQWPASIIAHHASDERNGQKSVHMETAARDLKVKVEFKTELQVTDDSQMETVRQLLGDERFLELFKIKYEPRAKNLKMFLNTGSTAEAVKTAKDIIKESVTEVDKTPYVSVEKGSVK